MYDTSEYWVQAAPFRALAGWLLDTTGLPWTALANHAHVPAPVMQNLLFGRGGRPAARIHRECARRLLALDEHRLRRLARLQYQ